MTYSDRVCIKEKNNKRILTWPEPLTPPILNNISRVIFLKIPTKNGVLTNQTLNIVSPCKKCKAAPKVQIGQE